MNIINKKCVSTIIGGISGNVTYNGKTINIPRGSRFEMIDGKVLINGKPFEQYNEADCPIIKIEIGQCIIARTTGRRKRTDESDFFMDDIKDEPDGDKEK